MHLVAAGPSLRKRIEKAIWSFGWCTGPWGFPSISLRKKRAAAIGMCPASGDLAGQSPKFDTPPKFSSSHPKNGGWKTILSYWEGNFSGAMLNFAGVINFESWRHQKHRPKNFPNSSPAKQKTLSDLLSPIYTPKKGWCFWCFSLCRCSIIGLASPRIDKYRLFLHAPQIQFGGQKLP